MVAKVGIDAINHRYYLDGDGPHPGVTTITGVLDKPALTAWHKAQVAGAAWDDAEIIAAMKAKDARNREAGIAYLVGQRNARDFSAERGTDIHALTEAFDRGTPPDLVAFPDELDGYLKWVDETKPEWWLIERYVFNTRLRYGGTLDRVATIDGELWLLDLKSSKSVADRNGRVWDEMRLQLHAYAGADLQGLPGSPAEPMPKIDRLGIVHVGTDGTRLYEVPVSPADRGAFVNCLDIWRWKQGEPKRRTRRAA